MRDRAKPEADPNSDLLDRQAVSLAVAEDFTFEINAKRMPFVGPTVSL